jgi:hypothetical protein
MFFGNFALLAQAGFIEPPMFLFIAAFVACLACGYTMQECGKYYLRDRVGNRNMMLVPFLGVTGGTLVLMISGLNLFGFSLFLAFILGFTLVAVTARLIWWRIEVDDFQPIEKR